jgi:hypothetical protein
MPRLPPFRRGKKASHTQSDAGDEDLVLLAPDQVERVIDDLTAMVVEGMTEFPLPPRRSASCRWGCRSYCNPKSENWAGLSSTLPVC